MKYVPRLFSSVIQYRKSFRFVTVFIQRDAMSVFFATLIILVDCAFTGIWLVLQSLFSCGNECRFCFWMCVNWGKQNDERRLRVINYQKHSEPYRKSNPSFSDSQFTAFVHKTIWSPCHTNKVVYNGTIHFWLTVCELSVSQTSMGGFRVFL